MQWNPDLYDKSQQFVAEYGKALLEYVPDKTQQILDLGCGTGTLTPLLAARAEKVLGIDVSEAMIAAAKQNYPQLDFAVMDALEMDYSNAWDIIFSNAVFHWIRNHDLLLDNIHQALKPNGKLVCEFGAAGNVTAIEKGFKEALAEIGKTYESPFHFAMDDEFAYRLKRRGFVIEECYICDRPTPLKDGEEGLANWAKQFYQATLESLSAEQQAHVLDSLQKHVKATLWKDNCWVADYKRLRVVAVK